MPPHLVYVHPSSRPLRPGELETFVSCRTDRNPPRPGDLLVYGVEGSSSRCAFDPVYTVVDRGAPDANFIVTHAQIQRLAHYDFRIKRRRALCPKRRYTA